MALNKIRAERRILIIITAILLAAGFTATSLGSFFVSRNTIRSTIVDNELPLTSDTVYSEIQKDLLRPIFVSSMMASDTFLRDWALHNEGDTKSILKYLNEIQNRYGTFTSFFISEKSHVYYYYGGILKKVQETEPRDIWYFRVKRMPEPYEINVDIDMAHNDAMTIFINYRVLDYTGNFIGATGVGLNVDSVRQMMVRYQNRYGRSVYFVKDDGTVVLSASPDAKTGSNISANQGLSKIASLMSTHDEMTYQYSRDGDSRFLNVRYIPELKWFLFVEKDEGPAIWAITRTLILNLSICLAVLILVLVIFAIVTRRYQARLEDIATTDHLTGIANRQAFEILLSQAFKEAGRNESPLSVLILDLDHFKDINDSHGHLAGDEILMRIPAMFERNLRQSDIICRWGGEEFAAILKDCPLAGARKIAEEIRADFERNPQVLGDKTLALTVSVGIATLERNESIDSFIRRADEALYRAKDLGRNTVVG